MGMFDISILFLIGTFFGIYGSFKMSEYAAVIYVVISASKCILAIVMLIITKEKLVATTIMIIIGSYCTNLSFEYAKRLWKIPIERRDLLKHIKHLDVTFQQVSTNDNEDGLDETGSFREVVMMGSIDYIPRFKS